MQDTANDVAASNTEAPTVETTLEEWEKHEETRILETTLITDTERKALVLARRGQGLFRQNVMRIEKVCRVIGVTRTEQLVASHTKPWRDSANDKRLNGENGFVLTPTIDHLFDRGFISFENNGRLIVSPRADPVSLARMGIDPTQVTHVGAFSSGQKQFLDYHREFILRRASVSDGGPS